MDCPALEHGPPLTRHQSYPRILSVMKLYYPIASRSSGEPEQSEWAMNIYILRSTPFALPHPLKGDFWRLHVMEFIPPMELSMISLDSRFYLKTVIELYQMDSLFISLPSHSQMGDVGGGKSGHPRKHPPGADALGSRRRDPGRTGRHGGRGRARLWGLTECAGRVK